MAEHHLPPEPAEHLHHHHQGGKAVHADDLKTGGHRRRYGYYGGGGGDMYGYGADPARTLYFVVLVVVLLAGITALVLYLVYRPSRPAFAVTSVAVYSLSLNGSTAGGGGGADSSPGAAPTALAASFQFTLVIRNPNGRSAARYDRLAAYVAYRGEPITAPVPMPPLVQDADSAVAVAPVLGAGAAAPPVPVSPDTAAALATDVSYGVVALRVVVLGRVRFVSGPFRSGWHSMYARCDLLVGVRKGVQPGGGGGGGAGPEAPLLGNPSCAVDM
ncbi:NDR1/HIN1-like protein 1 [Oryza brachyantha]|uniref:NDR1/HIN1-like protein 1 n=1 Tax=Oryza brachyantha TaxID=4533 RepID=UPI001AD9EDB1|nr:NDR1/HIN1-like protein 1 [Oryza brachyantha]